MLRVEDQSWHLAVFRSPIPQFPLFCPSYPLPSMKVRRLEDKLDAKFLLNSSFSIRMDEPHFNKKQALLYPGLVCWPDGVSDHIFSESKLVVDRCHSISQL